MNILELMLGQIPEALYFALFNNGEQIPGTLMIENISTAGNYANIGINKEIRVCCKENANSGISNIQRP